MVFWEDSLPCLLLRNNSIVYAVWSSGDAYDEAQHIEQLKRHEVVWALRGYPETTLGKTV